MQLSPTGLLELAGVTAAAAPDWPTASGAEFSTERLQPGDIFFALPGAKQHGITFAGKALAQGASFIVSDRPHERGLQVPDPAALLLELGRLARRQLTGTVIGVTGSAGKTTTKDLLAGLLDAASTPGNLNTPLALACTLIRNRLQDAARDLILELGIDRIGEMAELLHLTRPDIGILTSIAPSHLDGLGTVGAVAAEKAQLLHGTRKRYISAQAAAQLKELPAATNVYGPGAPGSCGATLTGSRLELRSATYQVPQPGTAFATNLCGALCLALDMGHEPQVLAQRLDQIPVTPGRLQFRTTAGRTILDDSYNSNPASARSALEVLRLSPAPHAAILGDMRELGSLSRQLHEELGQLTRGLDVVIVVGDHAGDLQRGNPNARTATDTRAALELLSELPEGGTVLVKASRSLGFEGIVAELEERG